MITWSKMLIVDDSKIYRRLMATSLRPYCTHVLTAASVTEAMTAIREHDDIDVVICDLVLLDGSGLELLEHITSQPEPRPRVLMVTAHEGPTERQQAMQLGAVDFLPKPTTVRHVLRALEVTQSMQPQALRLRWRCMGRAHVVECRPTPGDSIVWDIYNISPGGAFLETKAPLPIGTTMDLMLHLPTGRAAVRAHVVRVQEPSWMDVAGVGVSFTELDDEATKVIRDFIGRVVDEAPAD